MKAMIAANGAAPGPEAGGRRAGSAEGGQVRIRIKAAGVSFATTLVIAGKYQRRPPFPFAPGTEVSGVVTEVDAGLRLEVGDEVVAVLDWGGLAEEVVAHEVNVFPKPRNVDFVEAVQLAISYPTSAGALAWPSVLDVRRGQTLLVHAAAGGVGMAAVEIGKILGATVIATAGAANAQDGVRQAHGAAHVIDYTASDFRDEVLKLTDGRGVDRVYDPVGGDVFAQSLRCMAVEGRICPIGFAGGIIPQIPANILLVKSIAVMGFNYGYYVGWSPHDARFEQADCTFALMERIRGWCELGLCRPHVDRTFRLGQAAEAMRTLLERSVTGRVAVVMEA